MSTVPFDTHAAVKRLTEAGMAEAQAEALIRAISDAQARADLATRSDLNEARGALSRDIDALRHELKQDIDALRHELKQDVSALESRLIKWMVVQTIAIIGLTVTLVELLR